jgi:hypothetical protein
MLKQTKLTLTLLALSTIFLLGSMSIATGTTLSTNVISPNAFETGYSIEFVDITAGLGSSALVSVFTFGGNEDNYPTGIDPLASYFANALGWVVYGTDIKNYAAYLNTPPIQTANNVTLSIAYDNSYTTAQAFDLALSAKAAIESKYGITLYLTLVNTQYVKHFIFTGGLESSVNSIINNVVDFSNNGFAGVLDASTISGAPVKAAGYGARTLGGGNQIAFHGAIWVDANGVANAGVTSTAEHSISTGAIFNDDLAALSGYGLSRIRVNIPYPISPTAIYPEETSNALPHVTGRAWWDVRHPISSYEVNEAPNYGMDFDIGLDSSFPMVENVLSINQTLLNEGTAEFNFDLTNTGQADAHDINLAFPVGPHFQEIADQNITLYRLKEGVELNESHSLGFNVLLEFDQDLSSIGVDELNYEFLKLLGWYTNMSTSDPLFLSDQKVVVLINETVPVDIFGTPGDVHVLLEVRSDDFIPQMAVDALELFIVPALAEIDLQNEGLDGLLKVEQKVKEQLPNVLEFTFNATLESAYEQFTIFQIDTGDFTPVKRLVGTDDENAQEEWFLEATIPKLDAGDSASLSWKVGNVPTESDTFQLIDFQSSTNPDGYPIVTLESKQRDYADVMRFTLAAFDYHARPLSFQLGDVSDSLLQKLGATPETFASIGMAFTWENANGFKFFGYSNGQNMQVADNEAVLTSTVRFKDNQQVFNVGDEVTIEVEVTNNGDSPADDVTVHLAHAMVGKNFEFHRIDTFHEHEIPQINPGQTVSFEVTVVANTYIGYHPVFAIVEFTSDKGEGPAPVTDFLNIGVTEWKWAGETHHLTTSTLTGALLLPAVQKAAPAVPEPQITFSQAITIGPAGFTFKLIAENTGSANTTVFITQSYSTAELTLNGVSTTKGEISATTTIGDTGVIVVDGVELAPGEKVEIEMDFSFNSGVTSAYIPPAVAVYQLTGDSSLGDRSTTGTETSSGDGDSSSLLDLAASASAQEAAQQSATESGEYSAYSGGAAVGALAQAPGGTDGQEVEKPAFLGFETTIAIALISIPLVFGVLNRKRKL